MIELIADTAVIVEQLAVHEPQGYVAQAAVAKRLVGLFYRQRQQIRGVADVMLGDISGVEDPEIDRDGLGFQGLALRIGKWRNDRLGRCCAWLGRFLGVGCWDAVACGPW